VADTLVLSTAGVARGTFSAALVALAATSITLTGAVAVTGALTVSTTLGVTGTSTIAALIATTGSFSSTLAVTGISTFTGVLRGPAGSAAAPSYSASGDTNTGIYFPSADEVGFSLGGTGFLVGYRNIPQQLQNGNYTLVLADSGKHVYKASGGAGETITIPANGSVAYPIGTAITFINQGGGTLSIAITTDTMTLIGTGGTGTRTLADDGMATAIPDATKIWMHWKPYLAMRAAQGQELAAQQAAAAEQPQKLAA
jgi:hypothetical protein